MMREDPARIAGLSLHAAVPPRRRREGLGLWACSFALVLAAHVGLAAFALAPRAELAEGNPEDAINIDLVPDPSEATERRDDVPGPEATEATAPTSQMQQADDPDPPAPDAPPPTEVKRKPEETAPEVMAPPSPTEAEAPAAPVTEAKPQERPPEEKPPEEKPPEDAEKAQEERQTQASRASTGSAALLGGGRRPSAAAQATWRGAIGSHLVKRRRYPQEARAQGMQGTAKVRVTIDANGHVLSRDLVQSSGRPVLDAEALELMTRSDPFPKPPQGMPSPIVLTVPVNFAIR